jgi:hypothetical protein
MSKQLFWTSDLQTAFQCTKQALVSGIHPGSQATLSLAVDASATHIEDVLQQLENNAKQPLALFINNLLMLNNNILHLTGSCKRFSAIHHSVIS